MGLTSSFIYIMIFLDVSDGCAAGLTSGKSNRTPLWLLETEEGLGGQVVGLLRPIEAEI